MAVHPLLSPSILKRMALGAILEFSPILIFLSSYKHFHIYHATMLLMVATIVSTLLTYVFQKRLPYLALYVAILTIGFGYLTLAHHQPKFIQMRDTLYDLTCAITLLVGLTLDISFLKFAFNDVLPMTLRAWNKVTYAWIGFFIANAGLNEYIRRTQSLHEWFEFKGGMVLITIIFGLAVLWFWYEKSESK
jgi:intracellular septation protein